MVNWSEKKLGGVTWVGLTVIFVVAIVFIFRCFFNENSGASQAAFTGVLVIITGYYAWQTRQTVIEMGKQTKLQQMPVIVLYVRNIQEKVRVGYLNEQENVKRNFKDYLILIHTQEHYEDYYFALRNVGSGAAFNIDIKSNKCEISKYQSRFLAPFKDEQPFAIIGKEGKKLEGLDELKKSIFEIECKDISGVIHRFKYKIIDIYEKKSNLLRRVRSIKKVSGAVI